MIHGEARKQHYLGITKQKQDRYDNGQEGGMEEEEREKKKQDKSKTKRKWCIIRHSQKNVVLLIVYN